MSLKWTGSQSESGILRKSEFKEKKEELFVFGYSCKLFRDDAKALHIDQGKHLIPWMGDETLKIDRYDARGALHDLSRLEAPPGGYDWRIELTKGELDVEQLCDDERYRALHTDEDEEEMYKEEELKRLHAAGYGQVGFNYETPSEPSAPVQPVEVDEPFEPSPSFKALLPSDVALPESQKQNAIIEKTAKFIASQGAQMEILIKAKQGDNPQFKFLCRDSVLHPYYSALINLVKTGKWPENKAEIVEEKQPENEEYLHPSLASAIIESAPSIPSIEYKPSADCDYSLLVSRMRGAAPDEAYAELAPGEVAPPGTEPLPPRGGAAAHIARAPVLYRRAPHVDQTVQATQAAQYQQYAAYYHQYMAQVAQAPPPPRAPTAPPPPSLTSTGLSLMKNYNTDSDSDVSDFDDSSSTDSKDKPPVAIPPEDVQLVVDKMAAYVARNGDEFADIVRAKNDPRFTFLDPDNVYHAYYKRLMQQKRGTDANGKERKHKKSSVPVSFSIKKLKEPDPILPKPALPYESSSEEDPEKQAEKQEESREVQPKVFPNMQIYPVNNMPPVVVYKMEGQLTKDLPTIRTIETLHNFVPKPVPNTTPEVTEIPKQEEVVKNEVLPNLEVTEVKEFKESTPAEVKREVEKSRERDSSVHRREKRKHRARKKDLSSKTESRNSRRAEKRSAEEKKRERERESERDKKRKKVSKEELESEIISLEDNSDDLIDLTGDLSDSKGECETEAERVKQQERRRRAAEFLKKVGVDPAAAALPTSSLASAMVDTLESLRKKKADDEEKRRRREKRRHRDRRVYEDGSHRKSKRRKNRSSDDEDSDCDNSKKKKRKKEKKHSTKNKKKRRREPELEEFDHPLPANIDLTSTLKELRTCSPTKELGLQDFDTRPSIRQDSSSDEEREIVREMKKRRADREYSEGEWSSDTEGDSDSYASKVND